MIAIALSVVLLAAPAPDSRESLERQIAQAVDSRPSNFQFMPAVTLVSGGLFATLVGLLSGVHCDWGCRSEGTLDWGWASIGVGTASFLAGTAWLIALRVLRAEPNRRIEALEERLHRVEAWERRVEELEQREQEEAERRVETARPPEVRARLRELRAARPMFTSPVVLLSFATLAGFAAVYTSTQYFGSAGGHNTVNLALTVSGAVASLGLSVAAAKELATILRERQQLDDEIDQLREDPTPPPLPSPIVSRLPPAHVFLGYAGTF